MLVKRSGIDQLLRDRISLEFDPMLGDEPGVWKGLWERIEKQCANCDTTDGTHAWRYVASSDEIPQAEQWLLRRSGKDRDGFVSRHLNRPISRAVSQILLKTSITPNAWTFLILLFPLVGFLLLARGDYLGLVVGAALFHVHSVLDGCDGEIARAKYLDSEKGPGIDAFGDLIARLLFSIGLGFGLFRSPHRHAISHWVFLSEGV